MTVDESTTSTVDDAAVKPTKPSGSERATLFTRTLLLAALFHYAYASFVSSNFAYAGYNYVSPTAVATFITYGLIVIPLFGYKPYGRSPVASGMSILYTVAYIPMQLLATFMWTGDRSSRLVTQGSLAASMLIFFLVATISATKWSPSSAQPGRLIPTRNFDRAITALSAITTLSLIVLYGGRLRFVAFSEVYDLRLENSSLPFPAYISYLFLWQTFFFCPYLIGTAIVRRSTPRLLLGLLGGATIYMLLGWKIALLMFIIVAALNVGYRPGADFLSRTLGLTAIGTGVLAVLPSSGFLFQLKSLVFVRLFGVSGWNLVKYFDFFSEEGYTNLTHLRFLNGTLGEYPYGNRSLGQLVGFENSGNYNFNSNSSFWVSEGIAAFGPSGILFILPAMVAFFMLVNRVTLPYDARLINLVMAGFWVALLNLPFSTALLSGGFVWVLLMRLFGSSEGAVVRPASPTPSTSIGSANRTRRAK